MSNIQVLKHSANFYFRALDGKNGTGAALLKLVEDGKLPEDKIQIVDGDGNVLEADKAEAAVVAGTAKYKRVTETVELEVPNVDSFIMDGTLTVAQKQHLQGMLIRYMEEQQKVEIDNCTGKVINWAEVLEAPFTSRKEAVKITKEMREAAAKAVFNALVAIGATAKAQETIKVLVEQGMAAVQLAKFAVKPNVLLGIQTKFLEACGAMSPEVLAEHSAALEACTNALAKFIAPKEELTELDFS